MILQTDSDHHTHRLGLARSLLVLAVSLISLAPGIQVSFLDRDEGWYAQVSREMLNSGDWLTPHYRGQVWLLKPPLLYWLVTSSFRLVGRGEWQARLIPVLAHSGVVLLVAAVGARLANRRTGCVAGLILATTALMGFAGKLLLTDGPMLACTLGAVLLAWQMRDRPTIRCSVLYWLLIGVGILAKGPAILMYVGTFGLALLVAGWRRWIVSGSFWLTFPIAIAVAAPWYLLMARQANDKLVNQFLLYEVVARLTGGFHGPTGPPGYYLAVSLASLMPWLPFVPGALIAAWKERSNPRIKLLLLWLAIPWLALELIRAKAPFYVMPCYFPLSILLAWHLSAIWDSATSRDPSEPAEAGILLLWPRLMIAGGAVFAVAGCFLPMRAVGHALLAIGLAVMAGFAIVLVLVGQRQLRSAFATAIAVLLVFQILVGMRLLPALMPFHLSRQIAETINQARSKSPGSPVLLCGYEEPTMVYYLSDLPRSVSADQLPEALRSIQGPCVVAMTTQNKNALSPEFARELAKWPQTTLSGLNHGKSKKTVVQVIEAPARPSTADTQAESASAPTK